ncbi:hypothetical protein H312_02933 [Anncaliia algerae PRA339]|uniref:Uncharacterized protein n=1 Tax=Anncaliia algerae PRA339 TaxID=1288291 RepID=A0A059EY85_9MICR|nr:hypothetical protein H312_02933 [Anncaliia algerae PRA339]
MNQIMQILLVFFMLCSNSTNPRKMSYQKYASFSKSLRELLTEKYDEYEKGINIKKKPRISKGEEFFTDAHSKISTKETSRYEFGSNLENSFEEIIDVAFFDNDMYIYMKDFSKTKIIKILTQLSQNQKTFTTNCMNKFINLLKMNQLPCSLGILVNCAYYFFPLVDKILF